MKNCFKDWSQSKFLSIQNFITYSDFADFLFFILFLFEIWDPV